MIHWFAAQVAYPTKKSTVAKGRPKMLGLVCMISAALLLMAPNVAKAEEDVEANVEKAGEISENPLQLPAFPRDTDLQNFYVSPSATTNFLVDLSSISIGSDGIIRYTLVAQSSSGVRNITYEGLICRSFQRKVFAFGRDDRTWSVSRNSRWATIPNQSVNRQHAALARDYLCEENNVNAPLQTILTRLRTNTPSTLRGS